MIRLVRPGRWFTTTLNQYGWGGIALIWDDSTVTHQTIDGFLQQGGNHLGDNEVFNVQFNGTFLATSSIKKIRYESTGSITPKLVSPWGVRVFLESNPWVEYSDYMACVLVSSLEVGKETVIPFGITDGKIRSMGLLPVEITTSYVYAYFDAFYKESSDGKVHWQGPIYFRRPQNEWASLIAQGESVDYHRYFNPFVRTLSSWEAENLTYCLSCADYDPPHWGDLDMEAVQGTRAININTLMYVKELFEIGKMVQSTAASLMEKDPSKFVKQAANLYLSYHYGYRLTIQDTKTLYDAARAEYRKVARTAAASRARTSWTYEYPDWALLHGSVCKRTRTTKVWYSQLPHELGHLINGLFRWDVFPELGNVYDLIPYSFVVDWFLPFGDILDIIDTHTYASSLNVMGVVRSDRYEATLSPDCNLVQIYFGDVTPLGPVTLTSYRRWYEPEISYPPLQLVPQLGPKNWLPAGALILQRTK